METSDPQMTAFLQYLFEEFHFDVRRYSKPSLLRRLAAIQAKFRIDTVEGLRKRLERDHSFFEKIFPHFLISTTEMFRHPPFFRAFAEEVVPYLRTFSDFRLWVAGCSTGEELFSYIVVLHEAGLWERCSLYATDINTENLRKAREGIVDVRHMRKYSENYFSSGGKESLSNYFEVKGQKARFDAALLKNVCFSDHCLVTDKSFLEFQFISCRNVMIYFDRNLQDQVIRLFLESLSPRGYIGLGSRESLRLSKYFECFEPVKDLEAFYRRRVMTSDRGKALCH